MDGNKVSVLVTFYNQEKYVDDALKSVFMQETAFPFQVIVGDDGSKDGTVEKVREWQSKYPDRIRLVIQDRDDTKKYVRGARASRNRLSILQYVDTPYFAFLDGDDYYTDKNKLQKQYDILEKPENRDCVGCGHNILMYQEDNPEKSIILPGKLVRQGKYYPKKYWRDYYFHTDTIVFRSKYIKDLPFDLISDFSMTILLHIVLFNLVLCIF
ncbi:MAG: glycosyltransferase family 2 protein [Clostridia bacterium]|nr:glycosyltransferase family 2 protein [Clostridia bacterium]MBR4578665.1 glycosyltransferase family 2 protein [Oscillospiraceae bacterium]